MTDVIAHRGAHRDERENSIEAFRAAVAIGANGIELDVRRTADGAMVVHHDARLADGRALAHCLRADLPPWLPGLAEALDACAGAFVNLEIKNDPAEPDFDADDGLADVVVAHLAARAEPAATWLISSFRRETIDRCRRADPRLATAWLTVGAVDDAVAKAVAAGGHAAVHPWEPTVDAATVARGHAAGLAVNVWTCNDTARAVELAGWGVDGICTDEPAAVRQALDRGGTPAGRLPGRG